MISRCRWWRHPHRFPVTVKEQGIIPIDHQRHCVKIGFIHIDWQRKHVARWWVQGRGAPPPPLTVMHHSMCSCVLKELRRRSPMIDFTFLKTSGETYRCPGDIILDTVFEPEQHWGFCSPTCVHDFLVFEPEPSGGWTLAAPWGIHGEFTCIVSRYEHTFNPE